MSCLCWLLLSVFSQQIYAFQSPATKSEIIYRQANFNDQQQLLLLLDICAQEEAERLIVLPEKFRAQVLREDISAGSYFVAEYSAQVVAFKKLLLISDSISQREILSEEMGAIGTHPVESTSHQPLSFDHFSDVLIYSGGDFTLAAYRRKGINTSLMKHALQVIKQSLLSLINQRHGPQILFVLGVTEENKKRIPAMRQNFTEFIRKLIFDPAVIDMFLFQTYKPCFPASCEILRPLPAEESIPGYGCILRYVIPKSHLPR